MISTIGLHVCGLRSPHPFTSSFSTFTGMLPSLTPETRDNLIQPLIADLACHLVQGVRETDARKGWSSLLNSDGSSQGDHVRGAMLEAAGNFLLVMIDPATSGGKC